MHGSVSSLVRAAARIRSWHVSEHAGALLVTIAFAASRTFYYRRGVRLDWSTIAYFDQLLDPVLLRDRLAESLLYMHSQPPLYNLLTAIALKLVPSEPQLVLAPVFVACGLYTGLCLYVILLRLRVPVLVAAAIASTIVASPAFILYENWYFYPHLNVTWLLGAFAWLAQSRGCPGREMAIAGAHLAGLTLTRSLFHPLFFGLAAASIVLLVAPGSRRRALKCFLIPSLCVFVWCAKNQVLFGFFGTSSWASRNVARAVETLVGPERIEAETRRGLLSPATGRPFEPGDVNVALFGLVPRTTGVPALDNVRKHTGSFHTISYNHWSYAASAHFFAENARHLILAYPMTYLRQLLRISVPIFFGPVDEDNFFEKNRRFILPEARHFDDFDRSDGTRWVLAIGILLAGMACFASSTSRPERTVLALAFLTMAWVFAVGVVGEIGENFRFRYKVLWLAWAIAAAGYTRAVGLIVRVLDDRIRALFIPRDRSNVS